MKKYLLKYCNALIAQNNKQNFMWRNIHFQFYLKKTYMITGCDTCSESLPFSKPQILFEWLKQYFWQSRNIMIKEYYETEAHQDHFHWEKNFLAKFQNRIFQKSNSMYFPSYLRYFPVCLQNLHVELTIFSNIASIHPICYKFGMKA